MINKNKSLQAQRRCAVGKKQPFIKNDSGNTDYILTCLGSRGATPCKRQTIATLSYTYGVFPSAPEEYPFLYERLLCPLMAIAVVSWQEILLLLANHN